MSTELRDRGWYINAAGNKWVRDKARKKPVREKMEDQSVTLAPFLKGEAVGDFHLAVLLAVRELLTAPTRYTNKARALNKTGQVTEPAGGDARRWSIFGALEFFMHSVPRIERTKVLRLLKVELPEGQRHSLMNWEVLPDTTHFQVIRLISHTIDRRKHDLKYL